MLTIAGYVFYSAWKTEGAYILFGITLVNYLFGGAIYGAKNAKAAKAYCLLSIALDLGILCYFKYTAFFEKTLNGIAGREIVQPLEIILPIGISFYIFQCISYTVDIYRGRVRPTRNFLDFACYVSLFPHLVAGPILRYSIMEPQLTNKVYSKRNFAEGIGFFIVGLCKKVIIADTMAVAADALFDGKAAGTYACWTGVIAYTLQIFFDFSAYSDMAVGLGRMVGFKIPQNFNSPYLSRSFADFWRRWHMTLSYWLRDFLYIPLGGNRRGRVRTYFNLIITMVLGGLWHGAAWTFVFWGFYHGLLLAIERLLGKSNPIKRFPVFIQILFTDFMVMIGWVFFRAESFHSAISIIAGLCGFSGNIYVSPFMIDPGFILTFLLSIVLIATAWENVYENHWRYDMIKTGLLLGLFLVCIILIFARQTAPFIYAQF